MAGELGFANLSCNFVSPGLSGIFCELGLELVFDNEDMQECWEGGSDWMVWFDWQFWVVCAEKTEEKVFN